MSIAKGALYDVRPATHARTSADHPQEGRPLARHGGVGRRPEATLDGTRFDQFGLHATLAVKTIQALYYKAGGPPVDHRPDARPRGEDAPIRCSTAPSSTGTPGRSSSAYACRWAIECTFENCKQFLGLEDPANRLPKAVERTAPMALFLYSLVVVWFHRTRPPLRCASPSAPGIRQKEEPSFADLLTTLRRVSYEEKTERLLRKRAS